MESTLAQIQKNLEAKTLYDKNHQEYITIIKEALGDPDKVDKKTLLLVNTEMEAFQFTIRDNELKPMFIWTDKNGLPVEEPDIKKFTDEQLDYLGQRLVDCQSPILKARYSHILWLSKRKKIEYCEAAIDAYFWLVNYYVQRETNEPKRDHWLHFLDAIKNLFRLSVSTGYKLEETKALIIKYCLEYPLKSSAASVVRKDLASLMHDQKNVFKKKDFKDVVASLQAALPSGQPHHAIEILQTIIGIEQKLGNDLTNWKRRVAELWEQITRERGADAAIVSTNFCMKAILAYEDINDLAKVAELYSLYDELRHSVELHDVGVKFDAKELFTIADTMSDDIVKLDSNEIIKFLSWDPKIIPAKKEIIQKLDESEGDILRDVRTSVFDQKGNTHRYYSTENEKDIEQLIMIYGVWLQFNFELIKLTITKGIKAGKLSYNKVLQYLLAESWFGQELKFANRKDTQSSIKWLSIIAPGIVDFFVAMDGLIYSGKVFNVTTSFDSLTTKIEGIIRSLAEYRGIHTFTIKRDNLGREISEEKDLMKLITDPAIVELIGEDEIFFLRYVFTEKGGLNLRNKVAHSLISFEQYSVGHLMLIFVAILRLGRFKLKPRDGN